MRYSYSRFEFSPNHDIYGPQTSKLAECSLQQDLSFSEIRDVIRSGRCASFSKISQFASVQGTNALSSKYRFLDAIEASDRLFIRFKNKFKRSKWVQLKIRVLTEILFFLISDFFQFSKCFNYFIRIIINGYYLESDMLNHATSKSESNTALHIQRQYIQAFQAAQSQQVIVPFRFLTQFVSVVSVGGDWSLRIFLKIRQVYLQIIYFGHFIF